MEDLTMEDLTLYSAKELEEISGSLWVIKDSPLFVTGNLANKTDIGEELITLYSACRDVVERIEFSAEKAGIKL